MCSMQIVYNLSFVCINKFWNTFQFYYDFIVTNNNKVLGIIINTAEGAYVVSYNTTTNVMEAAANHVLDELY